MRLSTRCSSRSSAPRAEAFRLERLAELDDQLAGVAGDGLGRADRLGKGAAHLDEVRRAHRIDRLAEPSHGLIETAAEFGTEAQGERRAGFCQQIADALEAEDAKIIDHVAREPQRRDRQREIAVAFRPVGRR